MKDNEATKRIGTKFMVLVSIVLLATTVSPVTAVAAPPSSTSSDVYYREIAGFDRYVTGAKAVRELFSGEAKGAILAAGESHADALAASGLAGLLGYPILLTPSNSLHQSTIDIITAQGLSDIIIVGGEAMVSSGVEQTLKSLNSVSTVNRIAGVDRYDTAQKIYEYGEGTATGWDARTAVLVTGEDFADAVSISSFAASAKAPVMLIDSGGVPDESMFETLASYERVLIVGGIGVIADSVEASIDALEGNTDAIRLADVDRYQTSIAVDDFIANGPSYDYGIEPPMDKPVSPYYLASGSQFADALTVGIAASIGSYEPARLVLIDESEAGRSAFDYFPKKTEPSDYDLFFTFVGGSGTLPDSLRQDLINTIGGVAHIEY